MSSSNFDVFLSELGPNPDNSKLLKWLIELRKNVDWPKDRNNIARVREKGLKEIVAALQVPKKGVVDVALSILGNLCLDPRCAADVIRKYHALSALNQILKRCPKEDSINGRVFRIVGNLCRNQWSNVVLEKKPQIVIHATNFLKDVALSEEEETTSDATVTMGVRMLRELLNKDTLEPLVKTYGVLKIVGMLLMKYGAIWHETKRNEGIVINIVKLLQEYSRYRYYPCIVEMRNTDKGDSIAYLSKILLVAPRQIVKIVMNFLKISQLDSDLPVSEIFDILIDILRNDSIITEFNGICEECVKCICQLLEHPGNRKNSRCGLSVSFLVNILKDLNLESSNKIECCILILATLSKCRYNESLVNEQVNSGIVDVLSGKLLEIVGDTDTIQVKHRNDKKHKVDPKKVLYRKFQKRQRMLMAQREESDSSSSSSSSSSSNKDFIPSYTISHFESSPTWSIESELAMSWTSGLSPQSSPNSRICDISVTDSDDYSPVCSEAENSDFPILDIDDELSRESGTAEGDSSLPDFNLDSGTKRHLKIRLVMEIFNLLKTCVKVRPVVLQLGTTEFLLRLFKSTQYFDWPYTDPIKILIQVFFTILGMQSYLLPLMKDEFIPLVYHLRSNLPHNSTCSRCQHWRYLSTKILRQLTKSAESGMGKGDIAHELLRGDVNNKQKLVLVIPYIIKNKSILEKLMLNCGGLELLMKILREEPDLRERTFKTLSLLASKKLGIEAPSEAPSPSRSLPSESYQMEEFSESVTFQLDDGTCLHADKGRLSIASEFFNRLFNGDFRESREDVIALRNVSTSGLRFLMSLMERDIDKTVPVVIEVDIQTHLDAIGLCDRFLMLDMCQFLSNCLEKFRLNVENAPIIYKWSLESQTNLMRVECVVFALVVKIGDNERYTMFQNFLQMGCNEELFEDIKELLVRYMSLNLAPPVEDNTKKKKKKKQNKRNLYLNLVNV